MSSSKSIREHIETLRNEINDHDYRYYVLAMPAISDREYDVLMKNLLDLEEKNPEFKSPDSPTARVSGEPTKLFPSAAHAIPMLSLSNTYNKNEVIEFEKRI